MSPFSYVRVASGLQLNSLARDIIDDPAIINLQCSKWVDDADTQKSILLFSKLRFDEIVRQHSELDDVLCSYLGKPEFDVDEISLMASEESRVGSAFAGMATDFLGSKSIRLRDIATHIHRELGFPVDHLRKHDACTQNAQGDVPLLYPSPNRIENLIVDLETNLRRLGTGNAPLAAVIVNAAMVHCHMFIDGNQRTGRAMYNAFFPRAEGIHPIPMALLSTIYRTSYILKMRRVLILADWRPMILYVRAAHDAVASIQNSRHVGGKLIER